jgi:hypothetical protein
MWELAVRFEEETGYPAQLLMVQWENRSREA